MNLPRLRGTRRCEVGVPPMLRTGSPLAPARRLAVPARPHLLLVVNGHASGAGRGHRLEHAHSLLVGLGAMVESLVTDGIDELAEAIDPERRLVILGGDGSCTRWPTCRGRFRRWLSSPPDGRTTSPTRWGSPPSPTGRRVGLGGARRPLDLLAVEAGGRRRAAVEGVSVGFLAMARARYDGDNSPTWRRRCGRGRSRSRGSSRPIWRSTPTGARSGWRRPSSSRPTCPATAAAPGRAGGRPARRLDGRRRAAGPGAAAGAGDGGAPAPRRAPGRPGHLGLARPAPERGDRRAVAGHRRLRNMGTGPATIEVLPGRCGWCRRDRRRPQMGRGAPPRRGDRDAVLVASPRRLWRWARAGGPDDLPAGAAQPDRGRAGLIGTALLVNAAAGVAVPLAVGVLSDRRRARAAAGAVYVLGGAALPPRG